MLTLSPRSLLPLLILGACSYFSPPDNFDPFTRARYDEPAPRDVLSLRFSEQLTLDEEGKTFRPEEVAGVGLSPDQRMIYAGARSGSLFCLRAEDGTARWEYKTTGAITTQPGQPETLDVVYFTSNDGNLYALYTRDGSLRWKKPLKNGAEGNLAFSRGNVIVRLRDGSVLAVDQKTGEDAWTWRHELPSGFTIDGSSALVVSRGRVLFGTADGQLFALDAATGRELWSQDLAAGADQFADVDATPVVSRDTVFAASYAGGVYALSVDDGTIQWRQALSGVVGLSYSEERLYAASSEERLYSLATSTGAVQYNAPLPVAARDIYATSGYLFLPTRLNGLWIVDAKTGRLAQQYDTGNGLRTTPTFSGPSMYMLSNGGRLYAFEVKPSEPAPRKQKKRDRAPTPAPAAPASLPLGERGLD